MTKFSERMGSMEKAVELRGHVLSQMEFGNERHEGVFDFDGITKFTELTELGKRWGATELRGQGRSQVQLGNEEAFQGENKKGILCRIPLQSFPNLVIWKNLEIW
jgi:hypothetical protein